jgi:hypothetical protein
MIPSGLTSSVINQVSLGDGFVRVHDSGLVVAVCQFLYDEASLLRARGASRRPMISRRSRHVRPGFAPAPACHGRTFHAACTASTAASPATTPTRGRCARSGAGGRL